jgi:Leucine Rich repeat
MSGVCYEARDVIQPYSVLVASKLTTLDISHNHFGENGCLMLASNITGTSLEILNLSCTDIEDRGCVALADALESSS